jgi:2-polyprenyl-3-methyl-5-hydroxy-6-metoxy-1,4-benzoquinol methylase
MELSGQDIVIKTCFEKLRITELQDTVAKFRHYQSEGCRVLEIGAGTGWQSRALSEMGYKVEAIDLPITDKKSNHARARVWEIKDYDGCVIPFGDKSFDIVYSSNVLEHVEQLESLTQEILRVLAKGGVAIHLIPNPTWRIISLISYYPAQLIDVARFISRKFSSISNTQNEFSVTENKTNRSTSFWKRARLRLIPPTHGSVGTPISEIRRYSKRSWDDFFIQSGWEIIAYSNNGIWATGDYLLGNLLSIGMRRRIGGIVSGIAHVYVLGKK